MKLAILDNVNAVAVGLSQAKAKAAVTAIAKGEIPHVTISY